MSFGLRKLDHLEVTLANIVLEDMVNLPRDATRVFLYIVSSFAARNADSAL